MTTPAGELLAVVHTALVNDATLAGLLGGPRVFDHVPRGEPRPYVTFAQTGERELDADAAPAREHTVTFHVWSDADGRRRLQEIVAALRARLHDQPLTPAGHALVNLRHESSDIRRPTPGEPWLAVVRFRAVTEPVL